MRILFCPCHYLYDEVNEGSEFSWSYNIADRISLKNPKSVVVTGKTQLKSPKPYKTIEMRPKGVARNPNPLEALKFNWSYFVTTTKQMKNSDFDIMHHVLPFAIGKTFNLYWLLKNTNNYGLILGPVQNPLEFDERDKGLRTLLMSSALQILQPILSTLSKKTMRKANRVVVIHQKAKNLVLTYGVPENKIEIIPPGIDIKKFALAERGKQKDPSRIELFVACNLTQRKGVELIIKALEKVISQHKNVRLTIAGDGPQKKTLEQQVEELHLKPFVHFEGAIPNSEIRSYYGKSHVFVNMSRSEGFATVCLEAMASGLAIISSKVGGFSDAITNGVNGYLVDQEDYDALADRIISLIENPILIEKFGKAARKDAENKYDWESVIIPKYINLYEEAIR